MHSEIKILSLIAQRDTVAYTGEKTIEHAATIMACSTRGITERNQVTIILLIFSYHFGSSLLYSTRLDLVTQPGLYEYGFIAWRTFYESHKPKNLLTTRFPSCLNGSIS